MKDKSIFASLQEQQFLKSDELANEIVSQVNRTLSKFFDNDEPNKRMAYEIASLVVWDVKESMQVDFAFLSKYRNYHEAYGILRKIIDDIAKSKPIDRFNRLPSMND